MTVPAAPTSLRELALTFLRLGLTSFGGPAAHIALFRDEFVRRRRWLDDPALLDIIGAANLIPGPTSTEVAMHLGYRRAGWPGLVVAGLAFLVPAAVVVGILAALYVTAGRRPEVEAVLEGVAPVVLAVIVHAGVALGRTAIRGPLTGAILAATVIASLLGVAEIVLLLAFGLLAVAVVVGPRLVGRARRSAALVVPALTGDGLGADRPSGLDLVPSLLGLGGVLAVGAVAPTLVAVLGEFLKIGSLLFGSGYVLVAFLRTELVEGLGWITETQLLDAIAIGQATPGPYYTTATFVGYLVGGPLPAVVATFGIFLPGFVAVALTVRSLATLGRSPVARAFLDGVNAAAVGLLAVVALRLAGPVLVEPVSVAIGVASLLALLRGVGSGWLVALGAGIGIARLVIQA